MNLNILNYIGNLVLQSVNICAFALVLISWVSSSLVFAVVVWFFLAVREKTVPLWDLYH